MSVALGLNGPDGRYTSIARVMVSARPYATFFVTLTAADAGASANGGAVCGGACGWGWAGAPGATIASATRGAMRCDVMRRILHRAGCVASARGPGFAILGRPASNGMELGSGSGVRVGGQSPGSESGVRVRGQSRGS